MIDEMFIGENLKELRMKKGLTTKEMAELLSMSYSSYSGIERGRHIPSLYKMVSICNVLKISSNYLLSAPKSESDIPNGFETGFIRYRAVSYRRAHKLSKQKMAGILKMSGEQYTDFETSSKPLTYAEIMNIEFLLVRQERKMAV